ncbi:MAG: hypothetical protein QOF62_1825 [Pyrinomonadaceae bacterium]|jgi:hypothetical protein|nr:hypothetical protein [Pyrinomonadaceae bacterium]
MCNLLKEVEAVNVGLASIHYDPKREDYAVSGYELRALSDLGRNNWKDFCLVAFSMGLACALNAIVLMSEQKAFDWTLAIFLNSLFGLVGLALAICFGLIWRRDSISTETFVKSITSRPLFDIHVGPGNAPRLRTSAHLTAIQASSTAQLCN